VTELAQWVPVGSGTDKKAWPLLRVHPSGNECLKHINAETVDEAIMILSDYMGKAKPIAGGTDLIRLLRNHIESPMVLVNIKTIPNLSGITEDAEGLRIGTLTTIHDIETSPIIRDEYSMLSEAAHLVASPQIRRMATIGGNLCQSTNCWYYRMEPVTGTTFICRRKGGTTCYATAGDNRYHAIMGGKGCFAPCLSDLAPALVALDAKLKITGPDGERGTTVEQFYTPLGNILKPNELITEIRVPTIKPGTRQRYFKFRLRKAIDPALSSVAAAITAEAGVVVDARIVLGGVAPMPYRAFAAEGMIRGKVITENLAEISAKAAMSEAAPLSGNAYKVPITKALIKRALLDHSLVHSQGSL
jgi:xanthine dehydrogenase YagS FAD-binding subunit